ncbi:MAG TPA: hypothetical protein VMP08_14645 [Anaerolineae bacterium]|nr:hypothetical protein [Anaerolineae bacterium]
MKVKQPGSYRHHKEATTLHFDITLEERDLLEEMLDTCLTDLRGEISDTARHGYKEMLKQREAILRKLIAAIHEAKEVIPA